MKYGYREVLNVTVFNTEGEKVAYLDSLKESGVYLKNRLLVVRDALLDSNILQLIGKEELNTSSDYENLLGSNPFSKTITLGSKREVEVKLIAEGLIRNVENQEDSKVMFEIPKAYISTDIKFISDNHDLGGIADFDLVFRLGSFNEQGDVLKIHMK